MKNAFATMAVLAFAVSYVPSASADQVGDFLADINLSIAVGSAYRPLDLINWKVGDSMEYNLKMAFGGGKSVKTVTKDEGEALWFNQKMAILGQNQVLEVLINKADGKILKFIQNGKETTPPDDQLEVISQEYTSVTVPAGTFDCIHIVAKSKQMSKIQLWANPAATCMDGSLKTIAATQFGDVTLELIKFNKMP